MFKKALFEKFNKTLFFTFMALIYFLFIFFDLYYFNTGNTYSIILKYSSIIIFFILSLCIGKDGISKRDTRLLQTAIFFTLCADTCLLIIGNFFAGVVLFCIVQFIYIIRHSRRFNKTPLFISLALIIVLPLLAAKLLSLNIDHKLITIVIIYFIFLINSLISAIRYNEIVAVALVLFFFCDINVGISNILSVYPVYLGNMPLEFLTGFLVWIFYFPSQLLLALSGFKKYSH